MAPGEGIRAIPHGVHPLRMRSQERYPFFLAIAVFNLHISISQHNIKTLLNSNQGKNTIYYVFFHSFDV